MNEDQAMAFCSEIAPPSVVICLEIPNESAISRLTIREILMTEGPPSISDSKFGTKELNQLQKNLKQF